MSGAKVIVSEHGEKIQDTTYVLLQPAPTPARVGKNFQRIGTWADVGQVIHQARQSEILAVDLETRGNDYSQAIPIVGVGLAWDSGSFYFPWSIIWGQARADLVQLILEHPGLIAHNVYFDGGVMLRNWGSHCKWKACTLALFKQLANEGWVGQGHGLKLAQEKVLLWPETNEGELDRWLVVNGHYRGNRRRDESPETLEREWLGGKLAPEKGEMWRAPQSILGKYCVLDAEACYLLYTKHFQPLLNRFPQLREHHEGEWLHHIRVHIDQKIHGILMDRRGLQERADYLRREIGRLTDVFTQHEEVREHIQTIQGELLAELVAKEPVKYLKQKERQEPKRLTKSGAVSKNWLKWKELSKQSPVVSKLWENWAEKVEQAKAGKSPEYLFNPNSGQQLAHLFFDLLGYSPRKYTETGIPHTGTSSLIHFGEAGKILTERAFLTKELSYIEDYLERVKDRDTIHPSFKLPGPCTGRLASVEPNLQQVSKTRAMMSLFQARPGHVWVDLDFCLHPNTEYLSKNMGWITVDKLSMEDEIWQVNPETLQGSWTKPLRIIHRKYSGNMYTIGNRRGKLLVTENHRMLWINQKNVKYPRPYKYKITYSQDGIPSNYLATMATSSTSDIRGYCPSNTELNTACMLQADSYYDGNKYQLQLSLPRKRTEACNLLGPAHAIYSPKGKQKLEVAHWWNIEFQSPLLKEKSLYLEELDSKYAEDLVKYLGYWDGSIGRSKETYYYSTDYKSIDQVQRYLVRCGYECRLKGYQPNYLGAKYLYKLVIRKAKGIRLRKGRDDTQFEYYSGMVGCVTVPEGCILVRSGGQTFVTGNCALEAVVATELSQDENMLKLYSNDAPDNDIHLFVAAHTPGLRERILATGYRPDNPPRGSVGRAKKECKHERSIAKTCIAGGTPVRVYGRGFIPIEKVTNNDLVWDGVNWIKTSGAIDMGVKPCYNLEQVWMTGDHLVLGIDNEWKEAQEWTIQKRANTTQLFRPNKPSASWAEVWAMVCSFFRSKEKGRA